jgi:hypothetical protein
LFGAVDRRRENRHGKWNSVARDFESEHVSYPGFSTKDVYGIINATLLIFSFSDD